MKYFEHKFDAYKNNKKKIYTYCNGLIRLEEPYLITKPDTQTAGFSPGPPKEIDDETLEKYYKEITRHEFFWYQIDRIYIPPRK